MRFVGLIEKGDYEKISGAFSKRVPTWSIFFASPGGDVEEAIKMADFLDKYMIEVQAPHEPPKYNVFDTPEHRKLWIDPNCHRIGRFEELEIPEEKCVCASACAIIWLTVRARNNGHVLIHRPSFEKQEFSSLSNSDALKKYQDMEKSLRAYLDRKGVPQEVIAKIFSTASSEAKSLSDAERDQLPTNAAFDELVNARCGIQFDGQDVISLDKLLSKTRATLPNRSVNYSPFQSEADREAERKVYDTITNQRKAIDAKRTQIQPLVFKSTMCADDERYKHLVVVQGIVPYTNAEKHERAVEWKKQAVEELLKAFAKKK